MGRLRGPAAQRADRLRLHRRHGAGGVSAPGHGAARGHDERDGGRRAVLSAPRPLRAEAPGNAGDDLPGDGALPDPRADRAGERRLLRRTPGAAAGGVSVSADIGIWLGAIATLALYSILYRENAFYCGAEHI